MGIDETEAGKMGIDETGAGKMGIDEAAEGKVGIDKTGEGKMRKRWNGCRKNEERRKRETAKWASAWKKDVQSRQRLCCLQTCSWDFEEGLGENAYL